ncbi:DNA-directed RNA polymerase subunit omega [Fervidibacillus halotolerans]|uniref:DNA-directed RNA polymerase subunit omega n=1 Tax=Fervidibacillus halotolerans TaxID=2980027 RepID=A0A9E8M276_9BACI|nr:DNA-directed RNA polymerase subunit omega [Fervidibacillus halotolerans]WAA13657.1 DNA-directed RNA polymerase subunit omega [Fervidibacillus halotolerans]
MLYPSLDKLLEKVPSKYLLVTISAKRARQMQNTKEYVLDKYVSAKNVGKSLEEISEGVLTVADENEANETDEE